ncbi:ALDH-like protein [Guyanagaster necrorhizus]|uniref:ALDH-like protein n=1 Tax=Guyanagaster necrorhizus TaxID=856835 RepID=A0A9P7VUF0_9AGAR|nr:ALDH-like protein [Guyanagaster necrorhizus MCA 3950]KAG7447062.1 ALDH-like protein [Guyanagaster necrorhizus MCA 3950]
MSLHFSHKFETPVYKGTTSFPTGLFINGQFVDGSAGTAIDVINPSDGSIITKVSEATPKDVDIAVDCAQKAFDATWGLEVSGSFRADLMHKLANAMLSQPASLGKTYGWAQKADLPLSIDVMKYYAGWADKIAGKVIETDEGRLTYTRHEPIGVVARPNHSMEFPDSHDGHETRTCSHYSFQGPLVSKRQFDRVMNFIDIGKAQGATVNLGGERHGVKGYFVQPIIFTNTTPDMDIVQEEIFGPISCIKFEDEEDVVQQANDTFYGLAAAVFTKDITRALETAHNLKAGTAWDCLSSLISVTKLKRILGFKQSGFGREFSEYALQNYTNVNVFARRRGGSAAPCGVNHDEFWLCLSSTRFDGTTLINEFPSLSRGFRTSGIVAGGSAFGLDAES